ncbi:MAG: hypothetical protein ACYS7Y_12885 [Planctomycetota bacterium]
MFEELEKINTRPKPFEFYTASDLWTDEHTSKQMLSYHLNEQVDLSICHRAILNSSTARSNGLLRNSTSAPGRR